MNSDKTQAVIHDSLNNLELIKEIGEVKKNLKYLKKVGVDGHDYDDTLSYLVLQIIIKYKLPFDWFIFLKSWIKTGKKPKIKFNTKIKAELSLNTELFSCIKHGRSTFDIPEFSYITITTPIYAHPSEVFKIFKIAQKNIFSYIKPNKKLRPTKYKDVEKVINKMILKGKSPREIAKIMFKKNTPEPSEISKANDYKRNRHKRDNPLLKKI